jgi:hypothetical protein
VDYSVPYGLRFRGVRGSSSDSRSNSMRAACRRATSRTRSPTKRARRLLSWAAVSEITERLWAEYEDFCKRDLSEHAIVYLFVDGIAERLRPGQRRDRRHPESCCYTSTQ